MMQRSHSALIVAAFGFIVLASGLWRALGAPGGSTGLSFGIGAALVLFAGARDLALAARTRGLCLAGFGWAVVMGWFCFECFVRKSFQTAEIRQLLVLALGLLAAILLVMSERRPRPSVPSGDPVRQAPDQG